MLLHWGDHLNWRPLAWLGAVALAMFVVRMLTVWFYLRWLVTTVGPDPNCPKAGAVSKAQAQLYSKSPVVPRWVSALYFLFGFALIGITLWGVVSTAWWVILLGPLVWIVVHLPLRKVTLSWFDFQTASRKLQDLEERSNK